MDINTLQSYSKLAYDLKLAKNNLRERVQSRMNVNLNGGYFIVTPELISFLSCWEEEKIVLEDSYNNPVEVNRIELLSLAKKRYQEIMNDWAWEWDQQKKVRKASDA